MNKFKKGDMLVITTATEKENIGKVGTVIEVTDGDYYTLDCLPNYAYKENCVDYARGADLIREERRRQIEQEGIRHGLYNMNQRNKKKLNRALELLDNMKTQQ